uniref:Uncharacterized protein n=1 Tax=Rhodnius prolixus TaxID=13249 RepID=T1IBM9_RHOPR
MSQIFLLRNRNNIRNTSTSCYSSVLFIRRVYSIGGPLEEPGDRILAFQFNPEMYAELVFFLKTELKKQFIFRKKFRTYADNLIEYGKKRMKKQDAGLITPIAVLLSGKFGKGILMVMGEKGFIKNALCN